MRFDVLQKPFGTMDILVYLLEHGQTNVTSVLKALKMSRDTFYRAVGRLKALGFVFEERQVGYPTHKVLGLTKKGEEAARALAPVAEILAETTHAIEEEIVSGTKANPESLPRRLELLEALAEREFAAGRWDASLQRAEELRALAEELDDFRRQAAGHLMKGRVLQMRDDHEAAQAELGSALEISESSQSLDTVFESEYLLGSISERLGEWDDALRRFERASDLAEGLNDELRAAKGRYGVARIYGRQGRLEDSLTLLQDIVAELERLGAEEELPRVYAGLSATSYYLHRPDARAWSQKAIAAAQRVGDVRLEAFARSSSAVHLLSSGAYREAESSLRRAKEIFEDLGERAGQGGVELNLATVCTYQGRWSDAERHFDSAFEIAREVRNPFQEGWVLFERGMMNKRRGNVEEARSLVLEARRIFSEIGSENRVAGCDEELADLTETGTRR